MTLDSRRAGELRRATAPREAWSGRTLLTLVATGTALVLVGDRLPAVAYGTLVLVLLFLLLTNAPAAGRALEYVTNPRS